VPIYLRTGTYFPAVPLMYRTVLFLIGNFLFGPVLGSVPEGLENVIRMNFFPGPTPQNGSK
jgi:hypothetical protein